MAVDQPEFTGSDETLDHESGLPYSGPITNIVGTKDEKDEFDIVQTGEAREYADELFGTVLNVPDYYAERAYLEGETLDTTHPEHIERLRNEILGSARDIINISLFLPEALDSDDQARIDQVVGTIAGETQRLFGRVFNENSVVEFEDRTMDRVPYSELMTRVGLFSEEAATDRHAARREMEDFMSTMIFEAFGGEIPQHWEVALMDAAEDDTEVNLLDPYELSCFVTRIIHAVAEPKDPRHRSFLNGYLVPRIRKYLSRDIFAQLKREAAMAGIQVDDPAKSEEADVADGQDAVVVRLDDHRKK